MLRFSPVVLCLAGCLVYTNVDLTTRKQPFEEVVIKEAESFWTSEKLAIVDIHGLLAKRYPSPSLLASDLSADPVSDLKEALDRAAADGDVRGVLLRIDSPGGLVAWCDAMYREVERFRQRTGKPVLAYVTGLGASGGYYVALGAGEIWAAPASTVGSIGVIAVFLNLKGLAEKIGVEIQVVKSGPKKDMGSLWRGLAPEEMKVMQGMIDHYYKRFLDLVVANRKELNREELSRLADGRLLTAQQAQSAGLIDRVGYLDEALKRLKELAGLEDAAVIAYARSYQYVNNIYSGPAAPSISLDLKQVLGVLSPGFYYVWYPAP